MLLAALAAAVTLEMRRDVVHIEPISVPKSLEELGYSPDVVAQVLRDKIFEIKNDAKTLKTLRREAGSSGGSEKLRDRSLVGRLGTSRLLIQEDRMPDIDVPGTGISAGSVLRYARNLLRIRETRISGNVTSDNGQLRIRLRLVSQDAVLDPPASADLDRLLHLGAREILKSIEPYVLAVYLRHRERGAALTAIVHCLR
ncbi:MAG: hypothetical protein ACRD44_01670, partial [Bryobacteraceae bacterium]